MACQNLPHPRLSPGSTHLQSPLIGYALRHKAMFRREVVNEESPLVRFGPAVNPQLVPGNLGIMIALAGNSNSYFLVTRHRADLNAG
jgi:hypothetical protein